MAHLLRRTLKINAQRIIDTPALYFQLAPCIYTVYFQKAFFGNRRRIYCVALPKVYILVHFWQRVSASLKHRFWYNQRHPCRYWKIFNVSQNRHGWGWFQEVTSLLANLQPTNVHGCTFVGGDVRGYKQQRRFCAAKTRRWKVYTEVQKTAWCIYSDNIA